MSTLITLDTLAGDWRIFQLRRGHRFSIDDLLTAWAAVRARPTARLAQQAAGLAAPGHARPVEGVPGFSPSSPPPPEPA